MKPLANEGAHPFATTAITICGGLLIWAADFLAIYVIAALACAKGFAANYIMGVPLVAFVATLVTVGSVLLTALLLRVAVHKLRAHSQDASRFIYALTASIGGIALLAMFFNVLPAWLLATECTVG